MTEERNIYMDAFLWWKAEAILQMCGKGAARNQLLIAAVILVPIPHDVAEQHMKDAQAAIRETEASDPPKPDINLQGSTRGYDD